MLVFDDFCPTSFVGLPNVGFIDEAFRHCQAIAATAQGVELLKESSIQALFLCESSLLDDQGVICAEMPSSLTTVAKSFVDAIAQHRFWSRSKL